MGAWGVNSFDNDDAMDFLSEIQESSDVSVLMGAFERINSADDYVEAPECSQALAAAELVAAINKRPASELPEAAMGFINRMRGELPKSLISNALQAVERIRQSSELRQLWEESGDISGWNKAVSNLESRLR